MSPELDNVTVELVNEEDRVERIAVDQKGTTTTLRAGRYRIRLDSPSDEINDFPYRNRGETRQVSDRARQESEERGKTRDSR